MFLFSPLWCYGEMGKTISETNLVNHQNCFIFDVQVMVVMRTWNTSKGTTVQRVLFGRSNVYMLFNETYRLLVDTGAKTDGKKLLRRLVSTGKPDGVIMTHTHFDHMGNAGILKDRYAPVFIVHEAEKGYLESGNIPLPEGSCRWTRFISRLGAEKVPHWFQSRGVRADIFFRERYNLEAFGFNAYVLHTYGHSPGSASVIIDNEMALVGDALMGVPGMLFPPYADNIPAVVQSWKKLLDTGCHTFHPAHGFPVGRKKLELAYKRRTH